MDSRRRSSGPRCLYSSWFDTNSRTCNVPKGLVLCSIILVLFHHPQQQHLVAASSSLSTTATGLASGTNHPSAWQQQDSSSSSSNNHDVFPPSGSASSDDEGDLSDSDTKDYDNQEVHREAAPAFVVFPTDTNDDATAEQVLEDTDKQDIVKESKDGAIEEIERDTSATANGRKDDTDSPDVVPVLEEEDESTDYEHDDDEEEVNVGDTSETTPMSAEQTTDESSGLEQETVVSDAEANWFESDVDDASQAQGVSAEVIEEATTTTMDAPTNTRRDAEIYEIEEVSVDDEIRAPMQKVTVEEEDEMDSDKDERISSSRDDASGIEIVPDEISEISNKHAPLEELIVEEDNDPDDHNKEETNAHRDFESEQDDVSVNHVDKSETEINNEQEVNGSPDVSREQNEALLAPKLETQIRDEIVEDDSETNYEQEEGANASQHSVESKTEASDLFDYGRSFSHGEDMESVASSDKVPSVSTAISAQARSVATSPQIMDKEDFPASTANMPPSNQRGRTRRSTRRSGNSLDFDSSSQPLKTLQKLQNMLDETDYMTAAPGSRGNGRRMDALHSDDESVIFNQETVSDHVEPKKSVPHVLPPPEGAEAHTTGEKLWTSKDRMKYKKQQQRIRRAKREQRRLEDQLRSPPVHPNSSDDEGADDTDDGLGYTLPNLPVYFSDAEGTTTDLTDVDHPSNYHTGAQPQSPLQRPPPPPFEQRGTFQYPPPGYYPPNVPFPPNQNTGQPMSPYTVNPPHAYGSYGTYGPYNQQQIASQYASAWAAAAAAARVPPYGMSRPPYNGRQLPTQIQTSTSGLIEPRKPATQSTNTPRPHSSTAAASEAKLDVKPAVSAVQPATSAASKLPSVSSAHAYPTNQFPAVWNTVPSSTLAEASSQLSFDSVQKMSMVAIGLTLLCYSAVSPRNLPPVEYNEKFYDNLKNVSLMMIAPILNILLVFDPKENNINNAVNALYLAFSVGYGLAFLVQLIVTTFVRLGVFSCLEPDVFQLTPQVPILVLPWVLRENSYRPKRITLFVADFATSCVAAPIIEEYVKLKILQWSMRLPRNFAWITKTSSRSKRKRKQAEAIVRSPGDAEVTNINAYISQMLAVSIGIKLCDGARRILMYTKLSDESKGFYALCRGIFPIQELCGTMTALALAKRDVLGWNMPLWRMLAPAVVIHGMANFRGMKPLFKWNSATPWSEMQLLPWNAADDSTLPQLLNKGFAKLMWLVILGRVLGYCIKNYYLIRRQAVKRTTTYAGKRAAFSAELASSEMLKKSAKD